MKKKKNKLKILLVFILIDLIVAYLYTSSTSLVLDAGGKSFESNISNCSYYAIEECIKNNFQFNNICKIEKDSSGNIVFINTDTLLVNYIVKELALDCYDYMNSVVQNGVDVPVGVFTGIRLLSGTGPKINVKLTTTLSVECKLVRTFTSAGINQTRQTLSALIYTEIYLFAPFYKEHYLGNIEIPLFDNFIIGKVPNTYLDTSVLASRKINNIT